MAYSAIATVIIGEMLDETWHNTYLGDNFEHFADDHDHGSADHGSTELGDLTSIVLADGSDADAPGAGKTVFYSKAGKLWQRAGASGTAEELSITTHTSPN